MKTILCPVDFTPMSDRLTKYVSQLAMDAQAKVVLMATPWHRKKELVGAWSEEKYDSINRLEELRDMIRAKYHITCMVEDELVIAHPYKRLSLSADRYDLMVMGITSDQKSGDHFVTAGLDPLRIIQETLAPVMMIPDKCQYSKTKRLLYAHDYKHEPEPQLMPLMWLADWFQADVRFISVLQSNSSLMERNQVHSVHRKIGERWNAAHAVTFETLVGGDVSDTLDRYLHGKEPGDQLVLSVNHQSILRRLWHKSTIKGLLDYVSHPYIIIHR
jgi:hypothetical protein